MSRSKLYQMMDNGELAYVKLGRCRRIERRALIDLVSRELRGGYRK
ncbi:MAG: helix-turn-helix domain-containing protein [Planctomycetota bacterium]